MRAASAVALILAVLSAPAWAYSISAYRWLIAPTWRVNPVNFDDLDHDVVLTELRAGLQAWATASNGAFAFAWGGQTNATVTAVDGQNVVVFRNALHPSLPSALASTSCWYKNGQRYDCDVTIWQKRWFTGSTGCSDGYYLRDIMTHEFGHTVGVQHSSTSDATMYYRVSRCSVAGRTLAADDVNAVRALYPS